MFWINKLTGQKYYNKVQALKNSTELKFCVHEGYEDCDWLTEPTGSWEDIMLARAIDLREKHDYLRIYYSGGSDSHEILSLFLKHHIHIDEILMARQSPVNYFTGPSNKEINEVAIPFVNSIKDTIPNTKVTVCDIGEQAFNNYFGQKNFLTDCYSNHFRPGWCANFHVLVPGINDIPGVCNLDGLEKPTIGIDNTGIFLQYTDNTFGGNIVSQERASTSAIDNFFLEPKLLSKQCHIINNEYLKTGDKGLLGRKDTNTINTLIRSSHLPAVKFHQKQPGKSYSGFNFGSEKSRLLYLETIDRDPENMSLKLYKKGITQLNLLTGVKLGESFFVGTLSDKYYLHIF